MKKWTYCFLCMLTAAVVPTAAQTPAQVIGSWGTGAYKYVYLNGTTLWCAGGHGGLDVVDMANPEHPRLLARLPLGGDVQALSGQGGLLAAAAGLDGVWLVNTLDPENPTVVSRIATAGQALGLHLDGPTLYVADGLRGLTVVDVADAGEPRITQTLDLGTVALDVAVEDSTAVVTCGVAGVYVVRLNPFSSPRVLAYLPKLADARGVAIRESRALIACGATGVYGVDLRNASEPVVTGFTASVHAVGDVFFGAGHALAADGNGGLMVLDPDAPDAPRLQRRVFGMGIAGAVAADAAYAYVATGYNGLSIVALGADAMPIASYDQSGYLSAVDQVGDQVLGADRGSGNVVLYDISFPEAPVREHFWNAGGSPVDVAFADERALAAVYERGLFCAELARAGKPTLLELNGEQRALAVSGSIAALASGSAGVHLVDLAGGTHPELLAQMPLPGTAMDVAIDGTLMWVALYDAGIAMVDIADPTAPRLMAQIPEPNLAVALTAADGGLFVADPGVGVWLYSYTDNGVLTTESLAPTTGTVRVAVQGNRLYAARGPEGFEVFDITNRRAPALQNSFTTKGQVLDLIADGATIVVADGPSGQMLLVKEAATRNDDAEIRRF